MKRIILMDPELFTLRLLSDCAARQADAEWRLVGTFTSAEDLFQSGRLPDCELIVTALCLRDTDALGLLERLQSLPQAPAVLVLLPLQKEKLETELYAAGAGYCMRRPNDPALIFKRAAQLLEGGGSPCCEAGSFLRRQGLTLNDVGGRYIVAALKLMAKNGLDCKLVDAVYAQVAREENVKVSAVESGIRRTLARLERENKAELVRLTGTKERLSNGSFLRTVAARILKEG